MSAAEIIPIHAARLELPPTHPEGPGSCDVFSFLVRDGGSSFLIDTGVGVGSAVVENLYKPRRTPLLQALARHGVEAGALSGIANSHLHFDHCGNNDLFAGVPIFVQQAEYEAAGAAHYTVPSWLHFEGADYRLLAGRHRLSPHVELIPTPGHTVGHQSVLVETPSGPELVVAQAAYTSSEFESFRRCGVASREDAWSPSSYAESLAILHALRPVRAFFSHDPAPWQGAA
jgi:N-acyl homoserine lactone hydrolase